jgi:hypothetical protein
MPLSGGFPMGRFRDGRVVGWVHPTGFLAGGGRPPNRFALKDCLPMEQATDSKLAAVFGGTSDRSPISHRQQTIHAKRYN